MKTLAAPIARTIMTAAKRMRSCRDVIGQSGTGSEEAATLRVASESTNITTSESFSISQIPNLISGTMRSPL